MKEVEHTHLLSGNTFFLTGSWLRAIGRWNWRLKPNCQCAQTITKKYGQCNLLSDSHKTAVDISVD